MPKANHHFSSENNFEKIILKRDNSRLTSRTATAVSHTTSVGFYKNKHGLR